VTFESPAITELVTTTSADIAFTGADGVTLIPFEIERLAPQVVAWVRPLTIEPPAPLVLYVYFGGGVGVASPEPVWDATWGGVWHLSGDDGAPMTSASDSSPSNYALSGMDVPPEAVVGLIGGAVRYSGMESEPGSGDFPHLQNTGSKPNLDLSLDAFTVSLWVRVEVPRSTEDTPLWHGGAETVPGYGFFLGNGTWSGKVVDGSAMSATVVFGMDSTLADAAWHQLAIVVDGSAGTNGELRGYVDGTYNGMMDTLPSTGSVTPAQPFRIGRKINQPFKGDVDEVRVRRAVTSVEGLQLDVAAATAPVTVGAVEMR
jgi:hypothetical protein